MTGSQKILLVWGTILLFVLLVVPLAFVPFVPKLVAASQQAKGAYGYTFGLVILMLAMVPLQRYLKLAEWGKQFVAVVFGIGSILLPWSVLFGVLYLVSFTLLAIAAFVWMIGAIATVESPKIADPAS